MPYKKRPSRAKPKAELKKRGPKPGQKHSGQFEKGVSPNPGGMPKNLLELRALMDERETPTAVLDALEAGLAVAAGTKKASSRSLKKVDPYALTPLAKLLLEFRYGKAPQAVQISGPAGGPVETNAKVEVKDERPDTERIAAIAEALSRAGAFPAGIGVVEAPPADDAADDEVHSAHAAPSTGGVPPPPES